MTGRLPLETNPPFIYTNPLLHSREVEIVTTIKMSLYVYKAVQKQLYCQGWFIVSISMSIRTRKGGGHGPLLPLNPSSFLYRSWLHLLWQTKGWGTNALSIVKTELVPYLSHSPRICCMFVITHREGRREARICKGKKHLPIPLHSLLINGSIMHFISPYLFYPTSTRPPIRTSKVRTYVINNRHANPPKH